MQDRKRLQQNRRQAVDVILRALRATRQDGDVSKYTKAIRAKVLAIRAEKAALQTGGFDWRSAMSFAAGWGEPEPEPEPEALAAAEAPLGPALGHVFSEVFTPAAGGPSPQGLPLTYVVPPEEAVAGHCDETFCDALQARPVLGF